jgi:hypothetical protein
MDTMADLRTRLVDLIAQAIASAKYPGSPRDASCVPRPHDRRYAEHVVDALVRELKDNREGLVSIIWSAQQATAATQTSDIPNDVYWLNLAHAVYLAFLAKIAPTEGGGHSGQ